jgi:hypothetical protein
MDFGSKVVKTFRHRVIPDTGATRCIISGSVAKRFGIKPIPNQYERLFDAQKNPMVVDGTADITVTHDDNLLLLDETRIIVPASQRRNILDLLHVPHVGQAKTKTAARQLYFWPSLNNDIKLMVEGCGDCQFFLPSQPHEPLIVTKSTGPMSTVRIDLFSNRQKTYITMVDHYSGWIWAAKLSQLHSTAVTDKLTAWFQDWGWPACIRTDGGPQFRKEFGDFCKEHGISRGDNDGPSSPYHSQSNGLAEAAVKQAKHLLMKYEGNLKDFYRALAEFRNAPRADGWSAAQLFLNRRQRGLLPTLPSATALDMKTAQEGAAARQQTRSTMKSEHDKTAHPLRPLHVGQTIILQDAKTLRWDETGVIESVRDDGRSYNLIMADGSTFLRNRKFLRPRNTLSLKETENKDASLSNKPEQPRRSKRLADKKSVRL